MSSLENSKYEELCRLCATKTEMFLAINIFEDEGTIRQISKKIDSCLPVQIQQTDELPKMICETCLYKLELFSDFRERSVRTEKLLIELYKEISNCIQNGQQTCLVPITSEMLMVPHHLFNTQNVSDIELSSLSQNEQEIILTPDINSQSLENIVTNSLNSTEFSNQTFNTQETVVVDSNSEDNLSLMQEHQLLTEQFRLQQELQLNSSSVALLSDFKESLQVKLGLHFEEENKLLTLNDLSEKTTTTENYIRDDSSSSNSNSMNSIPLENQYNEITQSNPSDNLNNTNNDSILALSNNNVCNKSSQQRCEYDVVYFEHFHKCLCCKAVFTTLDVLNAHKKVCFVQEKTDKSPTDKLPSPIKLKAESKWSSDDSDPENEMNRLDDDDEAGRTDNQIQTNNAEKSDTIVVKKAQNSSGKVCTECGKTYKTNYKLSEHMRKHTGEKPYKCQSCDKGFRSRIGLAQHEAKHTGRYELSCPTCGKGFQCKSYLMVHQRVHSNIKPFPCTTCGQNFKTKQSLLDHTNRHLGVKPHICDICGRGFITKGLCRAHKKIHSGLDNRKYSCDVCDKMFVSKSYLQTHQRIHTGEKPFMCEVCGKGFLTRFDLKIHSTMHTGEKSFVCEMCGKAFARRDALRCHRRSHTGERPYSCDLCGQTFTQFTPMAIHKRLHTGERPYSCETCGKAFVSRSTMMSHAKKHV